MPKVVRLHQSSVKKREEGARLRAGGWCAIADLPDHFLRQLLFRASDLALGSASYRQRDVGLEAWAWGVSLGPGVEQGTGRGRQAGQAGIQAQPTEWGQRFGQGIPC